MRLTILTDCFRDIPSLKWTLSHSQGIENGPKDPVDPVLHSMLQCASFWVSSFLVDFDCLGTFPEFGIVGFQVFGLSDQPNTLSGLPNYPRHVPHAMWGGICQSPFGPDGGICRVHSGPSGDRNFPIPAFSDFRTCGDTLTIYLRGDRGSLKEEG